MAGRGSVRVRVLNPLLVIHAAPGGCCSEVCRGLGGCSVVRWAPPAPPAGAAPRGRPLLSLGCGEVGRPVSTGRKDDEEEEKGGEEKTEKERETKERRAVLSLLNNYLHYQVTKKIIVPTWRSRRVVLRAAERLSCGAW